jgi:cytochrome c556
MMCLDFAGAMFSRPAFRETSNRRATGELPTEQAFSRPGFLPTRLSANRNGDRPMIRTVFAAASVAAMALGVTVAIAQQDVIKERKTLMKANGDQAKTGAAMMKGEAPFDLAKAQAIFAALQEAAVKMPGLYPESSKSEVGSPAADEFSPSPKVWEDMADFKARFEKLGADAKAAAASVKDLDSFKAAFGSIGKNDCGGCHETYRLKKS